MKTSKQKKRLRIKVKMETIVEFEQEEVDFYKSLTDKQRKEKLEKLQKEFVDEVKSKVFMKDDIDIKVKLSVI